MTWIKVEFIFSQPAIIITVNQNMILNVKSNITRLHFLPNYNIPGKIYLWNQTFKLYYKVEIIGS